MDELLKSLGGSQLIEGLSQKTGFDQSQVSSVVTSALPQILEAVKSKDGGFDLGGILSSLQGANSSSSSNSLAGSLGGIINAVSSKTGVDQGGVSKIISSLAPLVLSYLSKGGQGQGGGIGSLVSSFLDKDKDGSVIDDLGDMLGGFLKKK